MRNLVWFQSARSIDLISKSHDLVKYIIGHLQRQTHKHDLPNHLAVYLTLQQPAGVLTAVHLHFVKHLQVAMWCGS